MWLDWEAKREVKREEKKRTHRAHGRRDDGLDLEEVLDDGGEHSEEVGLDEGG